MSIEAKTGRLMQIAASARMTRQLSTCTAEPCARPPKAEAAGLGTSAADCRRRHAERSDTLRRDGRLPLGPGLHRAEHGPRSIEEHEVGVAAGHRDGPDLALVGLTDGGGEGAPPRGGVVG